MELSERLKIIRKDSNLTQEELAKKIYVSRQAVSNYEQGKGYPSLDTLLNISKLFNVSLDELLESTAKSRFTRSSLLLLIEYAITLFIGLIVEFHLLQHISDKLFSVPIIISSICVIPFIGGIIGLQFQCHPPKINNWLGYRTKKSMQNPTIWNFAQINLGVCISNIDIIYLILTNVYLIISLFFSMNALLASFIVVIFLQLGIFIIPAFMVSRKIKHLS